VRTQPTRGSKDNWTKPRKSNKPTKAMKWVHIVELAPTRKGRDSSHNNKLRRINQFVTVNMTRIEPD